MLKCIFTNFHENKNKLHRQIKIEASSWHIQFSVYKLILTMSGAPVNSPKEKSNLKFTTFKQKFHLKKKKRKK